MPAIVELSLRGQRVPESWTVPAVASVALHAGLLATMRRETGFDRLHGNRFTLVARGDGRDGVEVRLGIPRDRWMEAAVAALEHLGASATTFRAGGVELRVAAVGPVVGLSAGELCHGAAVDEITLGLRTPTTFAVRGRHHRAVADPVRMVASWARAWDDLASAFEGDPAEQPPIPRGMTEQLGLTLAPAGGELRWQRVDVGGRGGGVRRPGPPAMVGFTGNLRLVLLPGEDDGERAQWLGRLARLAPFVGTGYRPQKGWGETWVEHRTGGLWAS